MKELAIENEIKNNIDTHKTKIKQVNLMVNEKSG